MSLHQLRAAWGMAMLLACGSSDDEADGCLTRLLDRDQQRRLAADRARLAAERDDAHE
jgi:hypothetical protein